MKGRALGISGLAGLAFAMATTGVAQVWIPANAPNSYWGVPAYSTNGDKVFAATWEGQIYASTNFGFDWTPTSAPLTNWVSVACSGDGNEIVGAVAYNSSTDLPSIPGPIFMSKNSGATWQMTSAPVAQWSSVACSFDGKTLLAAAHNSPLYISTDFGETWSAVNNIPGNGGWSAAVRGGGRILFAGIESPDWVFVSTNGGIDWQQTAANWDFTASSDGRRLASFASDQLYVSTDSGMFGAYLNLPSDLYTGLAGSGDGMHLVAALDSIGRIFTSDDGGTNWMPALGNPQGFRVGASPNGNWRIALSPGIWISYVPKSPPWFIVQPISSTNVVESTAVTFKTTAVGSHPIFYQWQHSGTNLIDDARIGGATTPDLTISNLAVSDTGGYTLVATNYIGISNSETAMLTVNADEERPVIEVSWPSATEPIVASGFGGYGAASDNGRLAGVWCRLNSEEWAPAQTWDNWSHWQMDFWPKAGMNTFSAFAVDAVGNVSLTNSVKFLAQPQNEVFVAVPGVGGKVKPPGNPEYINTGNKCRLTAVPDKGYIFDGWTGSIDSAKASIAFTVTNTMTMNANFIPNPFPAVRGWYSGASRTNSIIPVPAPDVLKVRVLAIGAFAASVQQGRSVYHFAGRFSPDGTASHTILPKGLPSISVELQIDLNGGNTVTGHFTQFGVTTDVVAEKIPGRPK